MSHYEVKAGPEAFLPPAAATMGNILPDPGEAHIGGKIVPEEEAYEHAARKILGAKVPTIFPGPLVLWKWNDHVAEKAKAIRELANEVPMRLIPMADYRPIVIQWLCVQWRVMKMHVCLFAMPILKKSKG